MDPKQPELGTARSRPRGLRRLLVSLRTPLRGLRWVHPTRAVFLGYLSYIVFGWALLCLPPSQQGAGVGALDNLFIATSAVSTTGLTTVSLADSYTFLGQLVVLVLIQLGGIGYMTLGSFLVLGRRDDLSGARMAVGHTVFSLPESFHLGHFIRAVIWFTLLIEGFGATVLYFVFRAAGAADCLWSAVFHSVSSFCTAGFSLYNNSFESYAGNFWLNATVGVLSYLGAIGFIVCLDFWRVITGQTRRTTLTTRVILGATGWLTLVGTILLFVTEPSLQSKPAADRLLAAFFQCMTAMTTVGFNTISVGGLSRASLLLTVVLMVIGSSPSGTGGGVKVTTLSAMLGAMRSAAKGEREVRFCGRAVPYHRVMFAFASLGFYLLALVVGAYLLEMTETSTFEQNLFEAASALGTVGLSMGITSTLSVLGKIIITLLMFCGRVGPLTFGSALLSRSNGGPAADNDVAI